MKSGKIFEEEILSDEELDEVVGGSLFDSYNDAKFFKLNGIKVFMGEEANISDFQYAETYERLHSAFAQFGVTLKEHELEPNRYFIGAKEVTHKEAINYIRSQIKSK